MSQTLTSADAKKSVAVAAKTWRYSLQPSPEEAVVFANTDPAQGAGEAVFSVRDDGSVDTFLFF